MNKTEDGQPVIVIDTREPAPSPWEQFFHLSSVRQKIDVGDYSLLGCDRFVGVERKTLNDLLGCLTAGRDRFSKELQSAARIHDFYVVVEGSYADLLSGKYRSNMHPKSAWESVVALQLRYSIPFLFAESPGLGASLCEAILLRWFREHQKAVDCALRAARGIAHVER